MSTRYQITDQEYKLLNLVAKPEAHKGAPDPYMTIYSGWRETLIYETIDQVFEFQQKRIREKGFAWQAVGRYQFVVETLKEFVQKTGTPTSAIFNNITQDRLALALLVRRGLRKWQSGSLSDIDFHVNLCKEWAGIPLPRPAGKGGYSESYYEGAVNSARGDPRDFLDRITNYRRQGPGITHTLDIGVSSRPYPAEGVSFAEQAVRSAGGGQNPQTGTPYTAAAQRRIQAGGTGYDTTLSEIQNTYDSILPTVENPYRYKPIDPLDNRYDFRSGEKVRDLLLNGYNPVSSLGLSTGNGLPPDNDVGSTGFNKEQKEQIQKTNAADDGSRGSRNDGTYTRTETIETPSGTKVVTKRYKTLNTRPDGTGGVREVEVKEPSIVTSTQAEIVNTRPDGTGSNILVNKPLPGPKKEPLDPAKSYDPRNQPEPDINTVDEYDEKIPGEYEIESTETEIATAPDDQEFDASLYCVKSIVFNESDIQVKIQFKETGIPEGDYIEGHVFKYSGDTAIKIVKIDSEAFTVEFSDGSIISKC